MTQKITIKSEQDGITYGTSYKTKADCITLSCPVFEGWLNSVPDALGYSGNVIFTVGDRNDK